MQWNCIFYSLIHTYFLFIYFLQVCVNHLGLFKQILAKWWDKCGCPSIYHMFPMYSYCSSMLCNCIFASKCVGGKKSSLWSNHHIHSNAQKSPTIICGMYWLEVLHPWILITLGNHVYEKMAFFEVAQYL